MLVAAWLGLAALTLLESSCTPGDNGGSSASSSMLPLELSPGVQIATLVSGGIAGLNDSVQVTYDWNLIVVRRDVSFVRRLDDDEQVALNNVLLGFASLTDAKSDGEDIADGMAVTLIARGKGSGNGTPKDAEKIFEILLNAAARESGD